MKLLQLSILQDQERQLRTGLMEGCSEIVVLKEGITAKDIIRHPDVDWLSMGAERCKLGEVKLLPPVSDPGKIICIGLNYRDHVIESNMQMPKVPVLFPKFNTCLAGHDDRVVIPNEVSKCDYEAELAVVIGRTARKVTPETALDYVYGYTIMNDVSARDIQLSEPQWTRGKAIDGFAPIGPWIVTADELGDPGQLGISLRLNGTTMQHSNTKELIFDVPFLVSFLSRTITLQPGDIISTGTPPGVGMGRNPQVWLQAGDIVEATIEGIGTLRNTFAAERG